MSNAKLFCRAFIIAQLVWILIGVFGGYTEEAKASPIESRISLGVIAGCLAVGGWGDRKGKK